MYKHVPTTVTNMLSISLQYCQHCQQAHQHRSNICQQLLKTCQASVNNLSSIWHTSDKTMTIKSVNRLAKSLQTSVNHLTTICQTSVDNHSRVGGWQKPTVFFPPEILACSMKGGGQTNCKKH